MSHVSTIILVLSLVTPLVLGAPLLDPPSLKKNGVDAQHLNLQFSSLKKSDRCEGTDMACIEGSFAQCVSGKWETTECAGGTQCFALPLLNKVGTSITCDTQADAEARISNSGASGGLTGAGSGPSSSAATDANDSNCTETSSAMNSTEPNGKLQSNRTDSGKDEQGTNNSSVDCNETTVTVTVTATSSGSSAASATLAPGFTLPPSSDANATATATGSASIETDTSTLNGTDTGAFPTDAINTTLTFSPASASAFLSSLSAANPGISIVTLAGSSTISAASTTTSQDVASSTNAASGSATPGAISLSIFTTTPTASSTGSPASLAAVASPTGYGYRVRTVPRGF